MSLATLFRHHFVAAFCENRYKTREFIISWEHRSKPMEYSCRLWGPLRHDTFENRIKLCVLVWIETLHNCVWNETLHKCVGLKWDPAKMGLKWNAAYLCWSEMRPCINVLVRNENLHQCLKWNAAYKCVILIGDPAYMRP